MFWEGWRGSERYAIKVRVCVLVRERIRDGDKCVRSCVRACTCSQGGGMGGCLKSKHAPLTVPKKRAACRDTPCSYLPLPVCGMPAKYVGARAGAAARLLV